MKVLLTSLAIVAVLFSISCNKTTGPSAGSGANSIFPLTPGSVWYYTDSAFQDSIIEPPYLDTMTVSKTTYQPGDGFTYIELNDHNGWFTGSFIAVDPNN